MTRQSKLSSTPRWRPSREAAASAGVAAGIHTPAGEVAALRLRQGYTFTTIASDLTHLELVAKAHLAAATAKD